MIKRIVLTGGPCAGKTTALAKIEQDLTNLGYKTFIVGESATELIKSGIIPIGGEELTLLDFQKLIMRYQFQKEELYKSVIEKYKNRDIVIIYDRGLLDNKAYITKEEFNDVLKDLSNYLGYSITEEDIIDRYDMVLHLVTSADGQESSYTLENNGARTEEIEEAVRLDKRTMDSWINHPRLRIIDNEKNFNRKIEKVLENIHLLLDNSVTTRKQLKYLVEIDDRVLEEIKYNIVSSYIEQIYIKSTYFEERIRKLTRDNVATYYYTKQIKKEDGESEIILNKKISKDEFNIIKNTCEIEDIVTKKRYSFIRDKQYYRLDEYGDCYILEVELTDDNREVKFPEGVVVKKDYSRSKLCK